MPFSLSPETEPSSEDSGEHDDNSQESSEQTPDVHNENQPEDVTNQNNGDITQQVASVENVLQDQNPELLQKLIDKQSEDSND